MKYLDHLEEWLISFLIGAATLLIFVAVVHRYASGLPIPVLQDWLIGINMSWAQELCIYMFVWMAKFGAAYGVRVGIHVGVDVLVNKLADKIRAKIIVAATLGGVLFTGVIAVLGARFVWGVGMRFAVASLFGLNWPDLTAGPISPDMELPVWIVYLAVPLGSALMCFRFLQTCVNFLRSGVMPHHDMAHVEGIEEDINIGVDDLLHPAGTSASQGVKP